MTEVLSEIICLREGAAGPPLFCMHYGNFTSVSAVLDVDRSVYGIRTVGLGGAGGDMTIERLAHQYLEHLRAVQAHGPYTLLGYSFGGLVAYEMARFLIDAGEMVALLALFDAPNPRFRESLSPQELDSAQRKYRADRRRKYWLNLKSGRFDRLALDLSRLAAKAFNPLMQRTRRLAVSSSGPSKTAMSDEARINALWHAYDPPRLNSRLVLFRAQGRDAEFGDDESMGWRRRVTDGVDVQFARGVHEEMMHAPYAEHLATQMMPYLHAKVPPNPEAPERPVER